VIFTRFVDVSFFTLILSIIWSASNCIGLFLIKSNY